MELALMTEPQLGMTYATLLDLARVAQRRGLAAFARSDHYAFSGIAAPHATDAFATLAGLARDTTGIELAVLVSPITFRHPAVIAKNAATLDEMSGGRFALGVGTGWMDFEHAAFGIPFPELGERFARLEEALTYLHHALGRRAGPFTGAYYALTATEVHPRPGPRVRLIVGGSGERRTPRLAGTLADEYNFALRSPADVAPRVARARRAAEAAGRDPAALRISVMAPVVVGEDQAAFARNLRRVAEADPWHRPADELEGRYRQRALPVGTGPEARAALQAAAALGIDRWYVQHFGPHDPEFVEETLGVLEG